MVLVIHELGFQQGIVLQRLSLFGYVFMTTYVFQGQHFKLVTQDFANLHQFVRVVGSKYYFHLFLVFLYTHSHLVESFAIDTDDARLRYEGVGVYHFDETEHIDALVLLGQDTEYLALSACVPTVSVEDGYAVIHLCTNGVGYLLPLRGEDEELDRLSSGIHDVVQCIVLHSHHAEAEHDLVGTLHVGAKLWEEHTRANDTEVGSYQHVAQCDTRMKLVDAGCNDVRTACGTIVQEDSGQSQTCQYTAYNH